MAKKKTKGIRQVVIESVEPFNYSHPLTTDKEKNRFIEDVKRIVRSSMEYRDYIAYLKTYVDMDHCAFFNKLSQSDGTSGKKIKIEIHHEPFTLHDYIRCILDEYLVSGKECDPFDIANECLRLHYENQVGLIPLSTTMHELVHNSDKVTIPLWMVYGNYEEFLENYEDYARDEFIMDKLEEKIAASNAIDEHSFDFLQNEFEYIESEDFSAPKLIETKEKAAEDVSAKVA